MRYAGFWSRLVALLIDTAVVMPLIGVSIWSMSSRTTALLFELPFAFAFAFYNIYLIGRWGQTLGKMAMKIRVVRVDGREAGFEHAFYRHAVDLAFSLIGSALTIYALMSVTDYEYAMLDFDGRLDLVENKTGIWTGVANRLSSVWVGSEVIVLLLNEKRRALHDFIAGTVVIHD